MVVNFGFNRCPRPLTFSNLGENTVYVTSNRTDGFPKLVQFQVLGELYATGLSLAYLENFGTGEWHCGESGDGGRKQK